MENNFVPNNFLLHSVQIYWQNIANTLQEVKNDLNNNIPLEEQFECDLNNTINTAYECSNLYGLYIHNQDYLINYQNQERLFYNQLDSLIQNHEFLIILQNIVRMNNDEGVRFFVRFLSALNIE
jgi:hypothetical protein